MEFVKPTKKRVIPCLNSYAFVCEKMINVAKDELKMVRIIETKTKQTKKKTKRKRR